MAEGLNPDGIFLEGAFVSVTDDLDLKSALANGILDLFGSSKRVRVIVGEADSVRVKRLMSAEEAAKEMQR